LNHEILLSAKDFVIPIVAYTVVQTGYPLVVEVTGAEGYYRKLRFVAASAIWAPTGWPIGSTSGLICWPWDG